MRGHRPDPNVEPAVGFRRDVMINSVGNYLLAADL